ncbi:MAG: hypothetical protein ABEJ72_03360, partial [Candidatus Aenigmatarchaeota archaeon]
MSKFLYISEKATPAETEAAGAKTSMNLTPLVISKNVKTVHVNNKALNLLLLFINRTDPAKKKGSVAESFENSCCQAS